MTRLQRLSVAMRAGPPAMLRKAMRAGSGGGQGSEEVVKDKIIQLLKRVAPEEKIVVEIPKEESLGDYSTNLAFVLAGQKKKPPLGIAQEIVKKLPETDFLEKIEVAPPGFINFYLKDEWLAERVGEILEQGEQFGSSKIGKGKKVLIEFISANPTGPLTVGNGRGGFFGDVLANVLEKAGYKTKREYYVNDRGGQIETLGASIIRAKIKDKKTKMQIQDQKLYQGEYIKKLAQKIKGGSLQTVGQRAAKIILSDIKKTVKKAEIEFNSWVLESSLIKNSLVEKVITQLKKRGLVYEKDGAVWFSSSKFGDDKDRVLKKQSGEFTYFAADAAYHLDKASRSDIMIDIWGADHHGDVSRILAIARVFGFEDKLKIILHQFAHIIQKGERARMSKRRGLYVTLDELIDEAGLDAVRFFFLTKSIDSHLDFDIEKAKEKSEQNPVYYIQYAYARCSSILRKFKTTISKSKTNPKSKIPNYKLLVHPAEISLIKHLIKFPDLVKETASDYQVQRLPFYAYDLANSFHNFYEKCKVLDEKNPDLTSARCSLIQATQVVLKNTLNLLGIKSPERM